MIKALCKIGILMILKLFSIHRHWLKR